MIYHHVAFFPALTLLSLVGYMPCGNVAVAVAALMLLVWKWRCNCSYGNVPKQGILP
jgi:hypothetical protein